MAPLLTKAEYERRDLFDITPGEHHIRDLIHEEQRYDNRTSDLVTGCLLLGVHVKAITKVEACWYAVPFTIGARLRVSTYVHEGHAFVGPDGFPMIIHGRTFHGDGPPGPASAYNFDNMADAPNYTTWLATTLYCGKTLVDNDWALQGISPPKRKANGERISAEGLTPSRRRREESLWQPGLAKRRRGTAGASSRRTILPSDEDPDDEADAEGNSGHGAAEGNPGHSSTVSTAEDSDVSASPPPY